MKEMQTIDVSTTRQSAKEESPEENDARLLEFYG